MKVGSTQRGLGEGARHAMAAWNVTICSSASSLLKMNSKNHVEQVLGMVPSPQVSPSTIRDGVGEQYSYGASMQQQSASKRGFYAAFAEQMGEEEMVVEEEIVGSSGGVVLKKRRLTMDQVRFLESNFESENKLEPERKVQIAQRLGLQPRQVAVWFQNRRARSKSKQLERDFLALKADYHAVLMENEKLQSEVDRLNAQLRGGGAAADDDVAEGGDGNDDVQQQQFMLIQDSSTNYKTSGSSSTNFPNLQSDDRANKPPTKPATKAEASTTSVGNDLQKAEELPAQPPCAILAGVNVNVNVSASVMPLPIPLSSGAAAVMAMVGDNAGFLEAALLPEDLQSLSNFMQQACAHQLLDLCTDSLHFDNTGLFLTAPEQDPWGDY